MRNGRPVYKWMEEWGIRVSDLDSELLASWILVGAEGEGEGGNGSGEGSNGNSQGGNGEGDSSTVGNGEDSGDGSGSGEGGSGDDDQDTFDRAYVEKLRRENASYRTKAKEAEDALSEKKKEEMSEIERAQTEAEEQKNRGDQLESEIDQLRLQVAVSAAANSLDFHDPEDALSLIDSSEISKSDDGEYNKQSVKAAVERLAKSKPHLIKGKSAGGSGDGGARGQGGGNMTDEQKQEARMKELQERGGVPLPKM